MLGQNDDSRLQHTPTVVKTSWSLFTSVISPGSFTLMLRVPLAMRKPRGGSRACAYAFGLAAMVGEILGEFVRVWRTSAHVWAEVWCGRCGGGSVGLSNSCLAMLIANVV